MGASVVYDEQVAHLDIRGQVAILHTAVGPMSPSASNKVSADSPWRTNRCSRTGYQPRARSLCPQRSLPASELRVRWRWEGIQIGVWVASATGCTDTPPHRRCGGTIRTSARDGTGWDECAPSCCTRHIHKRIHSLLASWDWTCRRPRHSTSRRCAWWPRSAPQGTRRAPSCTCAVVGGGGGGRAPSTVWQRLSGVRNLTARFPCWGVV